MAVVTAVVGVSDHGQREEGSVRRSGNPAAIWSPPQRYNVTRCELGFQYELRRELES